MFLNNRLDLFLNNGFDRFLDNGFNGFFGHRLGRLVRHSSWHNADHLSSLHAHRREDVVQQILPDFPLTKFLKPVLPSVSHDTAFLDPERSVPDETGSLLAPRLVIFIDHRREPFPILTDSRDLESQPFRSTDTTENKPADRLRPFLGDSLVHIGRPVRSGTGPDGDDSDSRRRVRKAGFKSPDKPVDGGRVIPVLGVDGTFPGTERDREPESVVPDSLGGKRCLRKKEQGKDKQRKSHWIKMLSGCRCTIRSICPSGREVRHDGPSL